MRYLDLPIRSVLPEVADALSANCPVVLQAPPGTGKTLLTAPYLMDAPWLNGKKIILLEPRRLAARMAATMMARFLGEKVGERVGYQVRLERCIGAKTQIEILTEGLLVQRLLHDQELADVGLVIFDEFHERSLFADFGLALVLDLMGVLRPDLRILVMSATIDAGGIARHFGEKARVVTAIAQTWPIETRYLERAPGLIPIQEVAAAGVLRALRETQGGILCFLPGEGEIRRTEAALLRMALPEEVDLYPLYGALDKRQQEIAVEPVAEGRRKVVLATSIAESSLTIQDVRVVVDTGWSRVPRFSVYNGMSKLETIRVTKDRADQRRGRAGRLGPGVCYRLWDEVTDRGLLPESMPEILDADLTPTRLQAAEWGIVERGGLPWVTQPPEVAWRMAGDLLYSLEALDKERRITKRGRRLVGVSAHPRLAHMIDRASEMGVVRQAAFVAAVVEEAATEVRLRGEDDVERLVQRIQGECALVGEAHLAKDLIERIKKLAEHFRRGRGNGGDRCTIGVGRMLSWAYPDRIAQKRDNSGLFRMAGGHGAKVPETSRLAGEPMIVVAELQDGGADGIVRLAASIDREDVEQDFAEQVVVEDVVRWDRRSDRVGAVRRRKLGAIVLSEAVLAEPSEELLDKARYEGIRSHGVENLGWTTESRNFQARINFLRRENPEGGWPDVGEEALAENLENWLGGWLGRAWRWEEIKRIDLMGALEAKIGHRGREVDRLAPTHWMLPCGHRARIHYDQGEVPIMTAKLQDFFGVKTTPLLAGGKVPVKITMLSPAQRPIAVTMDIAGFWRTGYSLVRKEMRGRYPKHSWPENPQ